MRNRIKEKEAVVIGCLAAVLKYLVFNYMPRVPKNPNC